MSPLTKEAAHYRVDLITEKAVHDGFIESFCDDGIYMRTFPDSGPIDLLPGARIRIGVHSPSGEKRQINCVVKWMYKTPPHGMTTSIGLEFLDHISDLKNIFETWQ